MQKLLEQHYNINQGGVASGYYSQMSQIMHHQLSKQTVVNSLNASNHDVTSNHTTTLRLNNSIEGPNKVIKIRNFQQLFGEQPIEVSENVSSKKSSSNHGETVSMGSQRAMDPSEQYKSHQQKVLELQEAMQKQEIKYDTLITPLFRVEKVDADHYYSDSDEMCNE